MTQHLAAHAAAANVDGDIVILDVVGGHYYCLPGAAAAFDFTNGARRIIDEGLAEDLAAADLTDQRPQPVSRTLLPTPVRQLDGTGDVRLDWRERWHAVTAYGEMLRVYYATPFGRVLTLARTVGNQGTDRDTPKLRRQVLAFRQWLPWAPFPGVCLFRSRMLLAFLRKSGLNATWVFGVRTWPFEAHCWLQVEDLVLDDTLDNVRNFTPIFTVGA